MGVYVFTPAEFGVALGPLGANRCFCHVCVGIRRWAGRSDEGAQGGPCKFAKRVAERNALRAAKRAKTTAEKG